MNQDQVKEQLLLLEDSKEFFTLTFSGKSSKKVNGLYKPESREIIIHNKNMQNENQLMYTAIHEFAHHIHFTSADRPVSNRSHTTDFWNIFHRLLMKAEEKGIYQNIFTSNEEFVQLTNVIKEKFISKNGQLMKELGEYLVRAHELCLKHHTRFEDYVDRILKLDRSTAKNVVKIYEKDIDPSIGYENMKTVSRIADVSERSHIIDALHSDHSVDMIKTEIKKPKKEIDPVVTLQKEKQRLERTINSLSKKLEDINHKLEDMQ